MDRMEEYWAGTRDVAPFAAIIAVFGVLLGYACTAAGLSPTAAVIMSATTFSGSAQFAAISIIREGGSVTAAVATAALLAARYLAMGATLAPVLRGSPWKRALVAQLVVDESWGVAYSAEGRFRYDRLLAAGVLVYTVHVSTTALGAFLGVQLGHPARWGLDAAFPTMFLLLVWPTLVRRETRLTAVLAASVALALTPISPGGVPVLAAGAAAFVRIGRQP